VSLENAKLVLGTNYFAVKNVTKSLLPILRNTPNGARVIVVASRTGQFKVTKMLDNLVSMLKITPKKKKKKKKKKKPINLIN